MRAERRRKTLPRMTWKSFAVGIVALLAVPFTAQAAGTQHTHWFAGSVTAAASGSVSVNVLWTGKHDTQLAGKTVTVAVDSSTQIVYGKTKSSIAPGDLVRVRATAADATLASLTAKRIHVNCNCHFVGGTVASIGGGSFAVLVAKTGPYDKALSGKLVTIQNGSANLTGLTLGTHVRVIFSASGFFRDPAFDISTATFTALRVRS
jgi:hypothetical protein